MAQPGDKVTFADGDHFYITVHGPLVVGFCNDCGQSIAVVGHTDRINQWGLKEDTGGGAVPRCSGCARRFHGLDQT